MKSPEGNTIIASGDQYREGVQKATELLRDPLSKSAQRLPLDDTDKANLREATRLVDSLSRFKPQDIVTYLFAGKAYAALEDTVVAKERYEQAIANGKFDNSEPAQASVVEAEFELSTILIRENEPKRAFELADKASKAFPNSAIYLTARASAEVQLQRYTEASADIAKALTIDPKYREANELKKLLLTTPKRN